MDTAEHRLELARFLRTRRARLRPAEVDLRAGPRPRRTPGLRREEVAAIAGLSVAWYTRLERGAPRRLHPDAGRYREGAASLPGRAPPPGPAGACTGDNSRLPRPSLSPAVRAMVTMVETCPAYVCNGRWDLLLSNRAGGSSSAIPRPRWPAEPAVVAVHGRHARRLHLNWRRPPGHVLAEFQTSYADHAGDSRLHRLVEAPRETSPEFAGWWDSYELRERGEWTQELDHPDVGRWCWRRSSRCPQVNRSSACCSRRQTRLAQCREARPPARHRAARGRISLISTR